MPNGTVLRNSVKPSHQEFGFGASMNGWLPSSWGPMSLLDKISLEWGLIKRKDPEPSTLAEQLEKFKTLPGWKGTEEDMLNATGGLVQMLWDEIPLVMVRTDNLATYEFCTSKP